MRTMIAIIVCSVNSLALGSIQTYIDNYSGFTAAAGSLHTIDFETLPNGSSTHGSEIITASFNYTAQGATFSAPLGSITTFGNNLGGNPLRDFGIDVIVSPSQRTWITVDLTTASTAIGVFFGGHNTIYAYDVNGNLLSDPNVFIGGTHFIGIVSDTPISTIVSDPGDFISGMTAFQFTPIPEPATFGLLIMGLVYVRRRPPHHIAVR